MLPERGRIVRSRAGHDKGRFYAVVRLEDGFVYVADGAGRPAGAPKKKNPLHLSCTRAVLPERSLSDDTAIREMLRPFEERAGGVRRQ